MRHPSWSRLYKTSGRQKGNGRTGERWCGQIFQVSCKARHKNHRGRLRYRQRPVLDEYSEREELGAIHADATATMNERRLGVAREAEKMRTDLTGIADPVERSEDDKGISLRQLAEVLQISVESFAAVWNDLPLEDAKIAELLGLTRQQVINARKSGRERLVRRLKGFI